MTAQTCSISLDTYEAGAPSTVTIDFSDDGDLGQATDLKVLLPAGFGVGSQPWSISAPLASVYMEYDADNPGAGNNYPDTYRPLRGAFDATAFIYQASDDGDTPDHRVTLNMFSYDAPVLLVAGQLGRISLRGFTNPAAGTYAAARFGIANAADGIYAAPAAPIIITPPPADPPSAPAITSITPGDGRLIVAFTAPTDDGGAAITGYEYSTDAGGTWHDAGTTDSPITIIGLVNGTEYGVTLRAVNTEGGGTASGAALGTPDAAAPDPQVIAGTLNATAAVAGTVSVTATIAGTLDAAAIITGTV